MESIEVNGGSPTRHGLDTGRGKNPRDRWIGFAPYFLFVFSVNHAREKQLFSETVVLGRAALLGVFDSISKCGAMLAGMPVENDRYCVGLWLWLFLLVLPLSIRPASAQTVWQPPHQLSIPGNYKPTIHRELITSLRIADLTVVLEETKLADVQSRLGGTIGQRGDTSEALEWLCFHGRDNGGSWILWLEAGEIHGRFVGAFQLRRIEASAQVDNRCPLLDSTPGIQLASGIRLGLPRAQTIEILGRPTKSDGDTVLYRYEHQQTTRRERVTASYRLMIRFRHAVLDAVDVWKMTVS